MKVMLKYKGHEDKEKNRANTLKKYTNPTLREGPYDFSNGPCPVDEKDAKVLIRDNPLSFEIVRAKVEAETPQIKPPKPVNVPVDRMK